MQPGAIVNSGMESHSIQSGSKANARMTGRPAGMRSSEAQASHHVVRTVPELITLSYTDTGNRKYQQDAVHVSSAKSCQQIKRPGCWQLYVMVWVVWQMAEKQAVPGNRC